MAYESATNPTTGEKLFLVDNKWVPPSETATNPKTEQRAFLVNNEWQVLDIPKAAPTAAPTAAPATEGQSDCCKSPGSPWSGCHPEAPRTGPGERAVVFHNRSGSRVFRRVTTFQ